MGKDDLARLASPGWARGYVTMRLLFGGRVVLGLLAAVGCRRGDAGTGTLPAVVDSGTLPQTRVAATLEAPLESGKNTVFCGSFQLAWNELRSEMNGEPVQLEGSPAVAAELNAGTFGRDDLGPEAALAMAGRVEDGVYDRIEETMQSRFPGAGFMPPAPRQDTAVYGYAYLEKRLPFAEGFDRLEAPLRFHVGETTVGVEAFGIDYHPPGGSRPRRLQAQVQVLDYRSDDDFILALRPGSAADEIVLAKVPPEASLGETVRAVAARVSAEDARQGPIRDGELLAVPIVVLGISHQYKELTGAELENPGWEGMAITEACQGIRFRLDEAGAALSSEARIEAKSAMGPTVRRFVFDRPFLLYLKEPAAETPYLVLWIETPELLVAEGSRR